MPARKYEQRLRAQTAEETRRRILDALYDRLRDALSEPVAIDEIARAAGVARSTVYLIFGSRAGLFDALTIDLLERSGDRILEAVPFRTPGTGYKEGCRVASTCTRPTATCSAFCRRWASSIPMPWASRFNAARRGGPKVWRGSLRSLRSKASSPDRHRRRGSSRDLARQFRQLRPPLHGTRARPTRSAAS